jgi:predicted house-cleaning noncanonical NTP pyrophosphatase (MazG superfamily)
MPVVDKHAVIVLGPQFGSIEERPSIALIGGKAYGLLGLPPEWSPPFLIITTELHRRWIACSSQGSSSSQASSRFPVEAVAVEAVRELSEHGATTVIVRSSAASESLDARGRYASRHCELDTAALTQTMIDLWQVLRTQEPAAEMAFVIQASVRPVSEGHLSNERRVSKTQKEWLCELAPSSDSGIKMVRFRARGQPTENALGCDTPHNLEQRLREVAASSTSRRERCHYEWIWDGQRLWVVQADVEPEFRTPKPSMKWLDRTAKVPPADLQIFKPATNSMRDWQKVACVRIFEKCGLLTGSIYILEDPAALQELASGRLSESIRADLLKLMQVPLIIRTDVQAQERSAQLLLPRTDALTNPDRAITFLIETAKKLVAGGCAPEGFCFLAHRYIPAMAGAFCMAQPRVGRVRIDSTWGSPDSLLFYSHDSYELDTKGSRRGARRIRCKSSYLDLDEEGNWIETRCGDPWDWKPSLTETQLKHIAEASHKVARELNKPVEVMYFVGIDAGSANSDILPWYYTTAIAKGDYKQAEARFSGRRLFVRTWADLEELKAAAAGSHGARVNVRLRPVPSLIRSQDFIDAVSAVAKETGCAVEIEGSVLSHIYYVLVRSGTRVRCLDVFDPKTQRQRFGKLVRDLIPVRIRSGGEMVRSYRVPHDQLMSLLKTKAVEEALELHFESDSERVFEELADLWEVIESTAKLLGRTVTDIKKAAARKKLERGGFEQGIVLVETEAVPAMRLLGHSESMFSRVEMSAPEMIRANALDGPVPKVRGRTLTLSLVPPVAGGPTEAIIPSPDDSDSEIVITYKGKTITLLFRSREEWQSNNQLSLF